VDIKEPLSLNLSSHNITNRSSLQASSRVSKLGKTKFQKEMRSKRKIIRSIDVDDVK
jgi:hypothetical protein